MRDYTISYVKVDTTMAGYKMLVQLMNLEKQHFEAGDRRIAKMHTEKFINVANELIHNLIDQNESSN